jgi:hypothetical protein
LRAEGFEGVLFAVGSFGALANADEVALLAPAAGAMSCLLPVCDSSTAAFNVMFNAENLFFFLVHGEHRIAHHIPKFQFYDRRQRH